MSAVVYLAAAALGFAAGWVRAETRELRREAASLMRERQGGLHHGDFSCCQESRFALAVADWLDACAEFIESDPDFTWDGEDHALTVARAYLGEAS